MRPPTRVERHAGAFMNSRAVSALFALVLAFMVGGAAGYWGPAWLGTTASSNGDTPGPPPEPTPSVERVVASGRLEPAGGVINLTAPGAGRIDEICKGVVEGALVKAGQV